MYVYIHTYLTTRAVIHIVKSRTTILGELGNLKSEVLYLRYNYHISQNFKGTCDSFGWEFHSLAALK